MGTRLTTLDRTAVAARRRDFTGTLVMPGNDGYDPENIFHRNQNVRPAAG